MDLGVIRMNGNLLDRAEVRIASANKAIAASVLILLITWNTGIEPMYAKLKAILDGRAAQAHVQRTRDSYTLLYRRLTDKSQGRSGTTLNGEIVGQIEVQRAISDAKEKEISLTSELRKLRTEAQLPLKLYGLEFFVRPIYAPLLWLLALAAILAFITASRREVFNLVSRHICRMTVAKTTVSGAPMEDHSWWMHPFPRRSGAHGVTEAELRAIANLGPSHARMHGLAILCILVGAGVTARILWIAVAFVRNLPIELEGHYLPSMLAGVMVLFAIAVYAWLRPMAVPDAEPPKLSRFDITRREVVLVSILAFISVSMHPLTEISKRLFAPKPRFRRWRPEQVIFYPADITDNVVEFITASPEPVAQVLRANLAVAKLSTTHLMEQASRRTLAAQLNSFLAEGGSMKLCKAAGARVSLSTKRFADRGLDRVGEMRFGRAVLRDSAPAIFRSAKRRWQAPVVFDASA